MFKKLFIVLLLGVGINTWATSAYGLYDFNNVKYEAEENVNDVRSIASITKLFTAYTILQAPVDLDEKIEVRGKSYGHFVRGSLVTRYDLLRAMLMSSDNLAAESLAHSHPGGYDMFVQDANLYIGNLGLKKTVIVDATGLLEGNKSTVNELKDFLFTLRKYSVIQELSVTRHYKITYTPPKRKKPVTVTLNNTNPQIDKLPGVVITKTGFTNPAGRCVAMLVEYKDNWYGVITLGNKNVVQRSNVVTRLFKDIQ
jgi:D-alanyl-D-alanine endopeptidase (penicillin-binding protein 7)